MNVTLYWMLCLPPACVVLVVNPCTLFVSSRGSGNADYYTILDLMERRKWEEVGWGWLQHNTSYSRHKSHRTSGTHHLGPSTPHHFNLE